MNNDCVFHRPQKQYFTPVLFYLYTLTFVVLNCLILNFFAGAEFK